MHVVFARFLAPCCSAWLAGVALAAGPAALAQPLPEGPQALSFAQAQAVLQAESMQLAADRKAVESAQLRRAGMQGLGGPSVAVTGMAYRYAIEAQLDTEPVRAALVNAAMQQPPEIAGAIAGLQLPSTYTLQRQDSQVSASVSALWPVYMGGLSDAVRTGLDGRTLQAQAQAQMSQAQLHSLLVQRYFGAQLAQRAAWLRDRALQGMRAHDTAAQRMLEAGVIAQVERLQARAALAEAEQQAQQARSEAQLAAQALARTLYRSAGVQPVSPLFVASQALAPLHTFQEAAWRLHPGLQQVQAKRTQAQALHDASEALRQPQVLAFGLREVNTRGKPNWMAGMAVRWTLWDSVDRDKLAAAGERAIEQADLSAEQVRNDLALLVEKNWLAVEQARVAYLSRQAQEDLARALLQLRTAGLQAGTSTALELMDAQLNLSKVQTERAALAHQYVQALAALLESSGQSEAFGQYMARADIYLPADAP